MHLKVVIWFGFVLCAVSSAPRRNDEVGSSNYVMIGNSNDGDEKNIRSRYQNYYPTHHRPSIIYQGGYNGQGASSNNPQTSLISAQVNLLEPFMLVTFLLFVLSLIDRAKILPLISRNDILQETSVNYTSIEPTGADYHHHQYQFLKMLGSGKRNATDF